MMLCNNREMALVQEISLCLSFLGRNIRAMNMMQKILIEIGWTVPNLASMHIFFLQKNSVATLLW